MKADYLYGTPYTIIQPKGMYHFNSDTEFLGRMMEIHRGDKVLDIGTNTGALLLYASLYTKNLEGIDLFEDVISAAEMNMMHNGITAVLHTGDVKTFTGEPYDVILCNPPYFPTRVDALKNDNPYLRAARHEEYLTPEDLFAKAKELLKKTGSLQMVHRASRADELVKIAERCGLFLTAKRISYDHRNGTEKSCILFFSKEKKAPVFYTPAYMDDRDSFAYKEEEICRY